MNLSTPNGLRLRFTRHGPPASVLELESFQPSAPGDGEVLIEMFAAPINPADFNFIQGNYGVRPGKFPAYPGNEGVGQVIMSRSPQCNQGDWVIPLRGQGGTWTSHMTLRGNECLRLPAQIDLKQAAMLRVNPATAWLLLHPEGKPTPSVVFNAANSNVGRCLLQFCALLHIRAVALLRRTELIAELQALCPQHALVLADDDSSLGPARSYLGSSGAALGLNAVGGASARRLQRLLGPNGQLTTYGAMAKEPLVLANGPFIFEGFHATGFWLSRWSEAQSDESLRSFYSPLAEQVRGGHIVQAIAGSFPLTAFNEAIEACKQGKVLLCPLASSRSSSFDESAV